MCEKNKRVYLKHATTMFVNMHVLSYALYARHALKRTRIHTKIERYQDMNFDVYAKRKHVLIGGWDIQRTGTCIVMYARMYMLSRKLTAHTHTRANLHACFTVGLFVCLLKGACLHSLCTWSLCTLDKKKNSFMIYMLVYTFLCCLIAHVHVAFCEHMYLRSCLL